MADLLGGAGGIADSSGGAGGITDLSGGAGGITDLSYGAGGITDLSGGAGNSADLSGGAGNSADLSGGAGSNCADSLSWLHFTIIIDNEATNSMATNITNIFFINGQYSFRRLKNLVICCKPLYY